MIDNIKSCQLTQVEYVIQIGLGLSTNDNTTDELIFFKKSLISEKLQIVFLSWK